MNRKDTTSSTESPAQRLLIRASAGTGKTFQLSSRYIAILRHSSPERILASTFTRKAAGEILERVLLRLAHAIVDDKSLQVLATSVGPPELTRLECQQLLAKLVRQLHRVRISTLDSFFSQLAGSYALELGLPPGWRILDPLEIAQIRTSAIEDMLSTGAPQDLVQLMHLLDKGQSSRSISRLITDTISHLYQVFLTAPDESWERFPAHVFLSREHRETLRLLIESVPLDKKSLIDARAEDLVAIESENWDRFVKSGLMPKVISGEMTYRRVAIPEGLRGPYLELYEHVLANLSEPWKNQTLAARQLLRDFHNSFERLKLSAGGLEFGDITRQLADAQRSSRLINASFRLDMSVDHLLLDEFQDTSPDQWLVIRGFAEEACRRPGRSFFCVGDTKQAIYGWRGGEAALFDMINEELPGSDSGTMELNQSYRSSPVIMETVNQAMTGLHKHGNLEDHNEILYQWAKRFPPHETARKELTGYACLRTLSERNSKAPKWSEEEDAAEPVEFWAEVAEYVQERRREAPGASIGILTRKNESVGRVIFELSRLGIEASEEAGNPLTDSAAVQLILSLMTLADHPGHTIAAFHVAKSPLGEILRWTDPANPESRVAFAAFLRRKIVNQGYGGVIHELLPHLFPFCNRREAQRLTQLSELADRYDTLMADLRPGGFVDFIEQQKRDEPTSAAVRVMTIHQSKGLEFDIVILAELDAALYLPPKYVSHSPKPGAPPDLVALYRSTQHFENLGGALLEARQATRDRLCREALCLLYVAMTRAVRSLHLLISPKVSKSLPKTFAGLLRAGLAPDVPIAPLKVLWEHGDPEWFRDDPKMLVSNEAAEEAEASALKPIRFASRTTQRHWKRQTPTGRKDSAMISLSGQFAPVNHQALTRGTLFHRWAEEIIWLESGLPEATRLERLARQLGVEDAVSEKWIREFMALLQQDWLSGLLSRRHYQEAGSVFDPAIQSDLKSGTAQLQVRRECDFAVQTPDSALLTGCIDRLVLVERHGQPVAAEIIDFKTDDLGTASESLAEKVESYRMQMESYRQAVSQLFGIPMTQVSARLCFLSTGAIVAC